MRDSRFFQVWMWVMLVSRSREPSGCLGKRGWFPGGWLDAMRCDRIDGLFFYLAKGEGIGEM